MRILASRVQSVNHVFALTLTVQRTSRDSNEWPVSERAGASLLTVVGHCFSATIKDSVMPSYYVLDSATFR